MHPILVRQCTHLFHHHSLLVFFMCVLLFIRSPSLLRFCPFPPIEIIPCHQHRTNPSSVVPMEVKHRECVPSIGNTAALSVLPRVNLSTGPSVSKNEFLPFLFAHPYLQFQPSKIVHALLQHSSPSLSASISSALFHHFLPQKAFRVFPNLQSESSQIHLFLLKGISPFFLLPTMALGQ